MPDLIPTAIVILLLAIFAALLLRIISGLIRQNEVRDLEAEHREKIARSDPNRRQKRDPRR